MNDPVSLRISLDWPAYYARFKEEHGEPVLHAGRLLFPDGWTYSSTDFAGPEWPPPADAGALRQLQQVYWRLRLGIVRRERDELKDQVVRLKELQQARSVPLQYRHRQHDEAAERNVWARSDLDIRAIETSRLAWLEEDVRLCRDQLQQLQEEPAHAQQS